MADKNHEEELRVAQADAQKEADEEGRTVVDCVLCGELKTAVERGEDETYCYYCDETDGLEACHGCGDMYKMSDMTVIETESGNVEYMCDNCNDDLNSDD